MDARTFESALSAAARVAFSVALVSGCSSSEQSSSANDDDLLDNAASPLAADPRARIHRAISCTDAGKPPPPAFTCSARAIQDIFMTNDAGEPVVDPAKVTPELIACCDATLTDAEAFDHTVDWEAVYTCCWRVPDTSSTWPYPNTHQRACTPWGPPVPPQMRPQPMVETLAIAMIHASNGELSS